MGDRLCMAVMLGNGRPIQFKVPGGENSAGCGARLSSWKKLSNSPNTKNGTEAWRTVVRRFVSR
jgi:hypothetical protein